MKPAIELRRKLTAGELTLGLLATDTVWPRLVELCKLGGLDYLIVDTEHGAHSDELVAHVCQLGRLAEFPVLIRTISTDYIPVRRALDMGPCGLMLPCVEDVGQLDAVRDAAFMPPRGRRRPGGFGNHWMSDFQYETWRQLFEEHLVVLPQIESVRGLHNVDAISAHEIVTALAVGPYDLSADIGCCWRPEAPELVRALQRIRVAAEAVGKRTWMMGDPSALVEQGFTFICVGEPSYVLLTALQRIVAAAHPNDTHPGVSTRPLA